MLNIFMCKSTNDLINLNIKKTIINKTKCYSIFFTF
jgi:hypothetical protein